MESRVMADLEKMFKTAGGIGKTISVNDLWMKNQIRAAVKEFAEMAESMELAEAFDRGLIDQPTVRRVREALAAFGVE